MSKRYDFETEVPCPYTTSKDLYDRLSGTICRYKGKPVYIETGDDYLFLHTIDRKKIVAELPYDQVEEIDVSSIELGYINFQSGLKPNKVIYAKRTPKRQWKQGLSTGNVYFENLEGTKIPGDYLHCQDFEKSIEGIFPTFEEARQIIGRDGECAISQEVALKALSVGVILLYLRGKNLGWIAPNSNQINLEDSKLSWVAARQLSKHDLMVA